MNRGWNGTAPVRTRSLRLAACGAALLVAAGCGGATDTEDVAALAGNTYAQTNLAATKASYHAQFTFPDMVNAWGLANRPKGAGGHFWVGAGGMSFQFVGDVTASPDPKLQPLFQDQLKLVTVPGADSDTSDESIGKTTGVVFNPAPLTSDFFAVRDQPVTVGGVEQKLSGSSRFIFATDSGKISAWTEQGAGGAIVREDGPAKLVFDGADQGMQFFGIALNPAGDKLLAADFGAAPQIRTFDKAWKLVPTTGFANPFATGEPVDPADPAKGKQVRAGDPAPFNVSTIGNRVFVAYATTKADPEDAAKLDAGEEDSADAAAERDADFRPGKGKVAEFDANGTLVRTLDGDDRFNAPWAVTVAPEGFGPLSGKLLIGNFGGTGRILAFDDQSGAFVDYVRNTIGEPIEIEGLWALMFGNGESLGDANALYFTAGPEDEVDGLFGSIRLK
ncbi:TIGR03118 family protein [Nocardia sp. NPDC050406]|uniref:TIGR03118 family protein n=1 Tax=Nocardia sp. NPDC050406 TaxID=3364318 RepID=UPI0037885063